MVGMRNICRIFIFTALLFLPFQNGFAVNISIPTMELMTWGRMENDVFGLFSRAYMEILFEGGYKFGGRVEFQYDDGSLEESRDLSGIYDSTEVEKSLQKNLMFKSISVEMYRLFESRINLVYFSGTTDVFASGDVFPRTFGTADIASAVKGYGYFPTGVIYDGIHTVRGTGVKLHAPEFSDWMQLSLYSYQDEYVGRGRYSSDFRGVFNREDLKIETFIGATYPVSTYGVYRAGLLFYYSTGLGGEFFTQIGIPRWDPGLDTTITIDNFYLLFEPRVRIDLFSIFLTLFWHPQYYHQQETDESGTMDIIIRFAYGDVEKTMLSAGLENGLTLQTRAGDQVMFRISPFLSMVTSGVIWDFKVNVRLYPYSVRQYPYGLGEIIETYIGFKTEL